MKTHDEAMGVISRACTVTILSYEEAIGIYLRERGILRDEHCAGQPGEMLGAPIPLDWQPPQDRAPVRMLVNKDTLARQIAGDPDFDCDAGALYPNAPT